MESVEISETSVLLFFHAEFSRFFIHVCARRTISKKIARLNLNVKKETHKINVEDKRFYVYKGNVKIDLGRIDSKSTLCGCYFSPNICNQGCR